MASTNSQEKKKIIKAEELLIRAGGFKMSRSSAETSAGYFRRAERAKHFPLEVERGSSSPGKLIFGGELLTLARI